MPSHLKDMENLTRYLAMGCEQMFNWCCSGRKTEYFDCCKYAQPVMVIDRGLCYAMRPPDTNALRKNASTYKVLQQRRPGKNFVGDLVVKKESRRSIRLLQLHLRQHGSVHVPSSEQFFASTYANRRCRHTNAILFSLASQ